MKKKKGEASKKSNLKLVFLFCLFIGLLILGSIALKIIFLIAQSKYDGIHRFTITVAAPQNEEDKKAITIYSFAPDAKNITALSLKGDIVHELLIGRYVGLPIDAQIAFSRPIGESTFLQRLLTSNQNSPDGVLLASLERFDTKTNLTIIDILRLFLYTKSVPTHSVIQKELITDTKEKFLDEGEIDRIVAPLFIDAAIAQERMSIQIINGTDTPGLANRLGRVLANMGANVIAVSTSEPILPKSIIEYYGKKNYTVEKIMKIFGFTPRNVQKPGISDIIIKLGKDNADPRTF